MKQFLKPSGYSLRFPLSLLLFFVLNSLQWTYAQPSITNASNTDDVILPCNGCSSASISSVDVLNTDMILAHLDPSSTPWPGAQDVLQAVVWSGLNGGFGSLTSAIYLRYYNFTSATTHDEQWVDLTSAPTTNPINPDVAIGYIQYNNTYQVTLPFPPYSLYNTHPVDSCIAGVVYEDNGDIYMETYWVIPPIGGGTMTVTNINSTWGTGPTLLSSGNGNAHHPHIDALTLPGPPTSSHISFNYFAVVWDEYNSKSGQNEVKIVSGDLSTVYTSSYTPDIVSTDGVYPDVACSFADASPGIPERDSAYVTYVNNAGTDLYVTEYFTDMNGVATPGAGATHYLDNADAFYYPRIEAKAHVDDMFGPDDQILWFVAAETDPTSGSDLEVRQYGYVVNFSSGNYLSTNTNAITSENLMAPAVCGTGETGYPGGGGPGVDKFTTAFYSSYTNNASGGNTNGDYYTNATDMPSAVYNPDYFEVNLAQLTSAFGTSPRPVIAVTNTSNSGYGTFVTWYDGQDVLCKMSGDMAYSFKQTGINDVQEPVYHIYPNPVTNTLNIEGVHNAAYSIINATGQPVISGTLNATNKAINTAHLPAGLYLLNLVENGKQQRYKFIRE